MSVLRKKSSLFMAMLAAVCVMLGGCAESKEEVTLITAKESQTYVSENLPSAKYVKEESGTDKISYYFEDDLCGFSFAVTSETVPKYFDATVIGYEEKTTDNWHEAYYNYLKDKVSGPLDEIAKANDFSYTWNHTVSLTIFLRIGTDKTIEELTPVLTEIGSLIKAEDAHGLVDHHELWCHTGDDPMNYDNTYAFYLFETGEVTDKQGREAYIQSQKQ